MGPRKRLNHRRYYVLAFPLVAVLGGAYLLFDAVFAPSDRFIVFMAGVLIFSLLIFEMSFSVGDWLEKNDVIENERQRAEEDQW